MKNKNPKNTFISVEEVKKKNAISAIKKTQNDICITI